MSYPDLPNNSIIVNGVNLAEKFKMVLVDGYTLAPPKPKKYTVEIPGGNGIIDLTEALLGDVAYNQREQTFKFYLIDIDDFESIKTEVSNFLHGKSYDYELTMDPDYTYHGRFEVNSYTHSSYSIGKVGLIEINISADPFKYKKEEVHRANAFGGIVVDLDSGRKPVTPTIETDGFLKVIFDNKLYTLPQGTWTINDIRFKNGSNKIYLNSYNIRNLTWGDLLKMYSVTKDTKPREGKPYYKKLEDDSYEDITEYYQTVDTEPNSEKTYYTLNDSGRYEQCDKKLIEFKEGVTYYEYRAILESGVTYYDSVTWSEFKTKRLYEWYKTNGTDGTYVIRTWEDVSDKTWEEKSMEKWSDLIYMAEVSMDIKDIYIKYEWGDL